MNRPATLIDVSECFRRFLDRELGDAVVAAAHIADQPSIWSLIDRVAGSTEALRRRVNQACGLIAETYDPTAVTVTATNEERSMLLDQAVARLARSGRGAPYESLFRDPRLYADRSAKWNFEKLIEIGAEEVGGILRLFQRNEIDIPSGLTLMSMGPKSVWLAEAAEKHFASYLAVEINDQDVADAGEWLTGRESSASKFITLAEMLASRPRCDVFHSAMTFQHIAPPAMLSLLETCLAAVRPGGFALCQIPIQVYDYRFDIDAYRLTPASPDDSEIHALPQRYVFDLFETHAMTPVEVIPDRRMGPMAFSFTYFARKRA